LIDCCSLFVFQVLKDADLIIIVSRIQRAVNDRSAKTLVSSQFRRQVFLDGRASGESSSLAFVCTQTDLLNRAELARNLQLADDATRRECALARNRYTTKRIKEDFRAGLRDVALAAAAGEDEEEVELPMELSRRLDSIKLPVFCCNYISFFQSVVSYSLSPIDRFIARGHGAGRNIG
jgi:hypothetical protein